eukprot:4044924-Prymnesium_polylepis.1
MADDIEIEERMMHWTKEEVRRARAGEACGGRRVAGVWREACVGGVCGRRCAGGGVLGCVSPHAWRSLDGRPGALCSWDEGR